MSTSFAPQLFIPSGSTDISFYEKAFGAKELYRFKTDDKYIHVAEFELDGATFYVHENNNPHKGQLEPKSAKGITAIICLFVDNVDNTLENALKHGAKLLTPAKDHFYGLRQAEIEDPYGHVWVIQKRIPATTP